MDDIGPGGPLFSLPREIRDEIYRYLVKGRYLFFESWMNYTRGLSIQAIDLSFQKADLAIFRVSKATFDEATSIFYSESIFRYHIDACGYSAMDSPRGASDRMMKIDVDIGKLGSYHGYIQRIRLDDIAGGLRTTLDKFSGLSSLRDTISIKFQLAPFYVHLVLMSGHLFRALKALVGFRTVIVYVDPPPDFSTGHKENDEHFMKIARAIEEEMVATLGPNTVRQVGVRTYLEFHPLEHKQADLRAQVDNSMMKMTKLGSEAGRPEQGV